MSITPTTAFRRALDRRGDLPLGTWIKLPALESVELIAGAGFDFVVIDLEHSPLNIETAFALIGTAAARGMSPIVRIPATDIGLIQRVLDSGAHGIMFPHIDSAQDAEASVRAMRFPPRGSRGVGNTSRAGDWGALDRAEYLRFGNDEVVCIVQIESVAAALAAGEIASVEGVDAVLIGAADLAVSEGKLETDTDIVALIDTAVGHVKATTVPVGNASGATEEAVRRSIDTGYDFTMLSNDATLLGTAARTAVATARSVTAEIVETTWHPTQQRIDDANIETFRRWLGANRGYGFDNYLELQRWSATDITGFWDALWAYFDVTAHSPYSAVLGEVQAMPGAQWFPGATLNYVDQVFRHRDPDGTAIIDESETGGAGRRTLSWSGLERQVGALAQTLRLNGVSQGHCVIGYVPNITEAVVAFLATASLGAIWASCGQDYSAPAAVDRLGQLDPTVLITADGYRYNGRNHDRREAIEHIRSNIPTLTHTIVIDRIGSAIDSDSTIAWTDAIASPIPLTPLPVAFDHPLWVLFSSGTSGKPKGIVHGHGGVLLEHLKSMSFHLDLSPGDVYFWYTSPSWMMWNYQIAGLLVGSTIVCYDGSPSTPDVAGIWAIAQRNQVTHLGTSPAYLQACEKARTAPAADYDLTALRTLGVTGSVLPPASYRWVAERVGADVQVASMTGGTDVVSAFATSVPTVVVDAGEISAISLGAALEAWDDDGRKVVGEVGEMVITKPLPSMPLFFWNDPDGSRYRDAYFGTYPGVWRHGDWITISERDTVTVHGRSDSTLNRNGIRMGSSDIYQAVDKLPQIRESLVIGVEHSDATYWMPLFVHLADGATLDGALIEQIRDSIRTEASPKHVPDEVIQAPAIPHTRTGKRLEIPIKRLFQGADPAAIVDPQSVDDSETLQWYIDLATARLDSTKASR